MKTFIHFLIHHVVTSVQAENVVSEVYNELSGSIERFFGEDDMVDGDDERKNESERAIWDEI
jgi:uncharacterized membrane protein